MAAAIADIVETLQRTSELASRVGRAPDDLAVRTFAGAVLGAMFAVGVTEVPQVPDHLETVRTRYVVPFSHRWNRCRRTSAELVGGRGSECRQE